MRETSPPPPPSITATTTMTITSPATSMTVITTLLLSESEMPRAFRQAISARNTIAVGTGGRSTNVPR
ncbi:hypothetical protein QP157_05060 [Sphingomonas sp. LR61]